MSAASNNLAWAESWEKRLFLMARITSLGFGVAEAMYQGLMYENEIFTV